MDVRDNFLYICSDNCNQVEGRLYGWYIAPKNGGGSLVERRELMDEVYDGSYVIVQNFPDEVTVCQDTLGSHGLYLYESDGYFAVCDSFLLLMEKLSHSHHKLTLNKDYIDSFLLNGYTMESVIGTPISEIRELPRNVSVRIDKIEKTVSLHEKILNERSVDIDSREGMELIDKWYLKWTGIICGLIKKGADIRADLSGGFDSRLIFMLMVGAKPKWDKIDIQSYKSKVHTFGQDYEIASQIAKHYGAKLNECENSLERETIAARDSLLWSFYIRMGFHKQLQFQLNRYKKTVYHFAGVGGETIRKYQAATKEKYIGKYRDKQISQRFEYDFMPGFTNTLDKSEKAISRMHKYLPEELGALLWNEGGDRHHHGKEMAEAFGSNELRIGPILDNDLQKIRYNDKFPFLLNAVLLMRFAPDLLNFKFDSNHAIPEATLKEAARINAAFPKENGDFDNDEYEFVMNELPLTIGEKEASRDTLCNWCKEAYESGFVKGNMCKLYPARVYEHAKTYYEEHDFYPMEEMWAAIAVAYSVHYAESSRVNQTEDSVGLLGEKKNMYSTNVEDYRGFRWPVPEHRLRGNCRIILYGAGNMGQAFYKQIKQRQLGKIILWVDKEPYGKGEEVRPLSELAQVKEYDVLLVAIDNREVQKEVIQTLKTSDFPAFDEDKIISG